LWIATRSGGAGSEGLGSEPAAVSPSFNGVGSGSIASVGSGTGPGVTAASPVSGAAFSPTHTRKKNRLYRYYVSQTVLRHGAGTCPVGRVPAAEIEAAVINQLRAVFRQPEIIIGTWKAAKVSDPEINENTVREALVQLDPLWDELFPAEQARIVQLLVERVDIGLGGLDVRLRVDGLTGLVQEMARDVGQAA